MKIIIAGSRTLTDYNRLCSLISNVIDTYNITITEVVSGGARGVDKLGERYAAENKIPCIKFPADWNMLGKSAGYVRNNQMAVYAEGLIVMWDGISRGTLHMLRSMKKLQKPTWGIDTSQESLLYTRQ